MSPPRAELYWVIGDGTGVGKTTLAAALVRVLGRAGHAAVGFKPYAAARLNDLIDFMLAEYPGAPCSLFGADTVKLAQASPLTQDPGLVDLVGPVQFLCHPHWRQVLLARSGSTCLANVDFFSDAAQQELRERADIRSLADRAGLPLRSAAPVSGLAFAAAHRLAPAKVADAFGELLRRGARHVVCEGAAMYLPAWQGSPPVDHVLLVADGAVHFLPDLRLPPEEASGPRMRTTRDLLDVFKAATHRHSTPLLPVESARRDRLAEQIVTALLKSRQAPPGQAGPGL